MPSTTCQATSSPVFRIFALWGAFMGSTAARAETAEPVAPPAARSTSGAEFAEAVRIFKSGDTARALPFFVRLGETTNSPNVQLYVGYCQLELGHERAAHQAFSQSVKLSRDLGGAKYVATQEAAQLELAKLNLRLASLTISFVELPAEFVVRLDGVDVHGVDDLIRVLDRDRVGRTLAMEVLRMGRLRAIDIHPIERKPAPRHPPAA